jgi:hypothetical protein
MDIWGLLLRVLRIDTLEVEESNGIFLSWRGFTEQE